MQFVETQTDDYRVLTAPAAGVIPGLDISQLDAVAAPGKTLRIVGNFALATLATGSHIGRAGALTNSTTLIKPTGAADWTNDDLVNKYLRVVGGGGAPSDPANGEQVLRPILANDLTSLTVNPVPGMDSTTRFQIVELATLVDEFSSSLKVAINIAACFVPVEIYGLDFTNTNGLDSLIDVSDSTSVKVYGCNISYNTANPAFNFARCNEIEVNHCVLSGSGDIKADSCFSVVSEGLNGSGGGELLIQDCLYAEVLKYTSDSAPSRVLAMIRVLTGLAEVTANRGAATPVYLESVTNFTATGSALLSGSSNTGGSTYGVEIDKTGSYTLTGSTITGAAGDVLFINNAVTWTNLSSGTYGIAEEHAANAIANSSYSKALKYGAYTFLDTVEFSARALYYGVVNPSQITQLTATGTTSSDAYQMLQQEFYRFDTVAAGTGAKLLAAATTALPGVTVCVFNNGANALNIYPPTGGQIDVAGADVSYSLASGAMKSFRLYSDDCLLWKSFG